jgi:hypothetical protein
LTGGRTATVKFAPGNKVSRGKLPGERNRATLMAERLLSKDAAAAMRKIGAAAKAGEPWALKFIGERFVPLTSRPTFIEPVDYTALADRRFGFRGYGRDPWAASWPSGASPGPRSAAITRGNRGWERWSAFIGSAHWIMSPFLSDFR